MKKRTAVIGALLSLTPISQTFLIGTGAALTSAGGMLFAPEKVKAEIIKIDSCGLYPLSNECAVFYYNRAIYKSRDGDYSGAISDYTKAIKIRPRDLNAYYNRGFNKFRLGDKYGAISDFSKVIDIAPAFRGGSAYRMRGLLRDQTLTSSTRSDVKYVCLDWKEANKWGDQRATTWLINKPHCWENGKGGW